MASILKKLLSYGSQKAPAIIDDVVDAAKPLAKRSTTIPTEVGAQVLGKGTSRVTPNVGDIMDAQIVTKNPFGFNASSQLDVMKKLGLTGAAAGTAIGVSNLMDEEADQPEMVDSDNTISKEIEAEAVTPEAANAPIETKQEALKPSSIIEQAKKELPENVLKSEPEKVSKQSEVEKALERVRQNRMAAAIQRSSAKLGAAIASTGALTKISADEESLKNLEEGIETPVQELKFKQEQEKVQRELASADKMADPNSEISRMTRNMLGQVGLSHLAGQNISAQDLKNAGIDVDSLLAKKIQLDQTAALKSEAALKRRDDRMSDMAARLAPKVQNKQYEQMVNLNNQVELIQNAVLNPNPQNDAAIMYSFVKTLDPNSAVRESEIEFTEAGRSIPAKIRQSLSKGATGQLLSQEERQNILDFAKRAAGLQTQAWKISASPYIKQAEKMGIPKEMITGNETDLSEKQENTVSKSPQGKVMVRRKSDGETVSMDASQAEKIVRSKPDKYERVD